MHQHAADAEDLYGIEQAQACVARQCSADPAP
jgi:hypothetical protein